MRGSVPLLARGLVYVLWTYTWEYSTGRVLDFFGARPWDYTELQYNIHGLIALEFAPLWYCACLASEELLISQILTLSWGGVGGEKAAAKVKPATPPRSEERNGYGYAAGERGGNGGGGGGGDWKGNSSRGDAARTATKQGKRRNGGQNGNAGRQTTAVRQNGAKRH